LTGKIDWAFVDDENVGYSQSFKFLADNFMLLPKPFLNLLNSLFATPSLPSSNLRNSISLFGNDDQML